MSFEEKNRKWNSTPLLNVMQGEIAKL